VPEYLAPGVYVEEVSFRSKSIEGVGTSTCAFAGPTRKGPSGESPELLTSFADYERSYGGVEDLAFDGDSDAVHNRNYIAHAAQAFFNNGGGRLYVVRALGSGAKAATARATPVVAGAAVGSEKAWFEARFVGTHFNDATVTVQQVSTPTGAQALAGLADGSAVRVHKKSDSSTIGVFTKASGSWSQLSPPASPEIANLATDFDATKHSAVLLNFNVSVAAGQDVSAYAGLTLGSANPSYIGTVLAAKPATRAAALVQPVALMIGAAAPTAVDLLKAFGSGALDSDGAEPVKTYTLSGGKDGAAPGPDDYAKALGILVGLEDVSIVAAPGYSAFYSDADPDTYQGIQDALLTHVADPRRYRMAVLDSPPEVTPNQMRDLRGLVDSTRGALYYPWVVSTNPLAGPNSNQPAEIKLPPSGHVCGIYARNDIERGVHKAPANEVVRGALRFEPAVNFGQQELLNPIGVNCLRLLSGRGLRVWGARTISSDPEWKYLNVRRYFNYLGASIDRGTQWAVFEPNGEMLWANVRGTISDFLYNEWRNGALLGSKPEEGYFVRCDRTTMTQNDLDNGRLICLIGVAVVKPAEFVIFRIGQKTADAKS
jgi:phage tail sheath protein FI